MKKALVFCLSMTALFFSHSVEAKILRVAYSGPAVSGVDYPNVQAAVNAAAVDDTIQLYQNASVGSTTVNKRLVFVGFGYSLGVNSGLQAVADAPNSVTLNFASGAEDSKVQGVFGNFYLGINNITISRCVGTAYLGYNSSVGLVQISSATLISSYLNINGNYGQVGNLLVSNCIINSGSAINVAGLFSNNIFLSTANGMSFGACVVKNNIFTNNGSWGCPSSTSAVFQNNLFSTNCSSSFTGSNNQFNINMTNVFVNWNSGSFGSESNIALKAGSPALGAGLDGNGNPTDAGIYGGEPGFVYKPSGIPAIPAIYQLTSPGLNANTNPYTITVSVRSNN